MPSGVGAAGEHDATCRKPLPTLDRNAAAAVCCEGERQPSVDDGERPAFTYVVECCVGQWALSVVASGWARRCILEGASSSRVLAAVLELWEGERPSRVAAAGWARRYIFQGPSYSRKFTAVHERWD